MLQDGLTWIHLDRYQQHWLKLDGIEIACVSVCYHPEWPWTVSVQRHRGLEAKLVGGHAKTLAHGKKMAERWAMANIERLRPEVAARAASRPRHRV
jgi:hypothetical protein